MDYRILPPEEMLEARVKLPLSKSISNRLLIINSLAGGDGQLPELAECEDTHVLRAALSGPDDTHINIAGAGTAMRFLTAYYAATQGPTITLDGNERMRQRPIGTLVDTLRKLGANIDYVGEEGFPPLLIHRDKPLSGGEVEIDGTVSSQFISALMMVAPTMDAPLRINIGGVAISTPYIRMTLAMMERYGIDGEYVDGVISISPGKYQIPESISVEGDWSAASYWYEISALSAGFVTLDGLESDSMQGDSKVATIFEHLGVNTDYEGEDGGIDLMVSPDQSPRLIMDMADYPDLVPAVVVTAAMLGIPFRLSGLQTLRIKECDRVEALINELDRLGIVVECIDNCMTWELQRRPIEELPRFHTYGDHRMAMALAPVALFVPGIVICDAEVVEKSYPEYWDHLRAAGFTLLDGDAPLPEPAPED